MTRRLIVAAVLSLVPVLVLGACGGGGGGSRTLSGVMSIYDTNQYEAVTGPSLDGHPCVGHDFYADVQSGRAVQVTNQSGTIIGTGQLGDATVVHEPSCSFPFTVHVPKAPFHVFQVGSHGPITKSAADVADGIVVLLCHVTNTSEC